MFNDLKREIEKDFDLKKNYFDIIDKATKKNKIKSLQIMSLASVACLIAIVIVGTNLATEKKEIPKTIEATETQEILDFENMQYVKQEANIDESNIEEFLGEYKFSGDGKVTKVYAIKGFSKDYFVATKADGDENYDVYQKKSYDADDLEMFAEDFKLRESAVFGKVVTCVGTDMNKYYDVDNNVILEILLGNYETSEPKTNLDGIENATISIDVSIPELGYEDKVIGIGKDGYLSTNLYKKGEIYVGEDRFIALLDYLTYEFDGEKDSIGKGDDGIVEMTITSGSGVVSDFITGEEIEKLREKHGYTNTTSGYTPPSIANEVEPSHWDPESKQLVYPD